MVSFLRENEHGNVAMRLHVSEVELMDAQASGLNWPNEAFPDLS